jgi:hypothetical protein
LTLEIVILDAVANILRKCDPCSKLEQLKLSFTQLLRLFLKVPRSFQRIGNFNQFDQVQRASQKTFTGLWIRNPPSIQEVSSAGCKWKPWPYNMPLHHVPLFLLPENQTKNPPKPGSF